jgi:hypothetical protein
VVTSIVAQVLSGTEMIDARGTRVGSDEMHSRALHISGKSFFFVEKPEIYDSETQIIWAAMMMIQR